VMAIALTLTGLVSAPMLWRLYRPRPALVDDSEFADDADEDHAQL
jgi:hypothetical protein